ncbi:hypothetical protein ACFFX1_52785 [Dactylosporangium sucinum]|uniref:Uncharacterized protein n=1 Tax=Dactylosporangium sucinum TaxID=1424081 RepID=A0A917X671_9ACTN|nr:hypothetical protein [Dactylosporangium sucinum]GGM76351.1 hypothetical protein GCM10007977_092290 [Dactylosporangium sucinum]
MSSGTSYDWAYEQERERQRQAELRAELERLRVRHRQLERLQNALATQGIRAARATVADVAQDASSAQLSIAVTEARTGLDALETRLESAVAERAQERAARWAATPAARTALPVEPSLGAALAEERAAAAAALARAAAELVEAEAARCADDERDGLTRLAERVGDLDAAQARRALTDLESRLSASIQRRRDSEAAEQVRTELLTLAGELPAQPRAALRRRIRQTLDPDLAGLGPEVRETVAEHRRRHARIEVTAQVLAALRAQGYELGESFEDLLADGRQVALLTSAKTPGYGVRLTIDPDRDRLQATTVRRDDVADDAGDEAAQRLHCADFDRVEADLATGGLLLRTVQRRPVRSQVATMPARHWLAADQTAATESAQAQEAEPQRRAAEHERQRQAARQTKGRTA